MRAMMGKVGLEFLRNYDELEAARESYLGDRDRLLEELGTVMAESAAAASHKVTGARLNKSQGVFDVDIEGAYVAIRKKHGDNRSSGYSCSIGSFLGLVGAQALLWFQVKLSAPRRAALEIDGLVKKLGDVELVPSGSWAYFRMWKMNATGADGISLEGLEGAARDLSKAFSTADEWIESRYERLVKED